MAEKNRFKSTVYVHDSDEEDNEEKDAAFFVAEEERRKNAGRSIAKVLAKGEKAGARDATKGKKGKKRKSVSPSALGSEDDEDLPKQRKKPRKGKKDVADDEDEDEIVAISSDSSSSDGESDSEPPAKKDTEITDTPISSQNHGGSDAEEVAPPSSKPVADVVMKDVQVDADNDADEAIPVRSTARRRGGFVVESDDEE